MLAEETFDEEAFRNECEQCDVYRKKWLTVKMKLTDLGCRNEIIKDGNKKHNLNLPKLEIRKFDDNPKKWLSFWSQYKKIHEDQTIDAETKFQYLTQAMTHESKARCFVNSYPPTEENYAKVIHTLKERYGKDDMLIKIYVRELLKLVNTNSKMLLSDFYDKITTNLQILESLRINHEKYECILLPLVETALPESTLLLWNKVPCTQGGAKLSDLLKFLQTEVEAERRADLTRYYNIDDSPTSEAFPTAAYLLSKAQVPINVKVNQQVKESCESKTEVLNNYSSINTSILLQTLIAKVPVGNQERKVRVLLDSGSQRSYIKVDVAKELGLQVTGSECLTHSLFGEIHKAAQIHQVYEFQISSKLVAIKTNIGWMIQGRIQTPTLSDNEVKPDVNSLEYMKQNIETLGIKDPYIERTIKRHSRKFQWHRVTIAENDRVKNIELTLRATQLFGCDNIRASWLLPSRVNVPNVPPLLAPAHSHAATIKIPLPSLPNEYPATDVFVLNAANDEWQAQSLMTRWCATRHPGLRPASVWLGIVPPGAHMNADLQIHNDTHQHTYWWGSVWRWWGEREPSAQCAGRAACARCRQRRCSCALLRPARGALHHRQRTGLLYDVNAPEWILKNK
ncbi:unnamed protein product [Diatraea saccharalis]|uniref:Peptidase aspartic putative domain-containing protein n=1 Tax=Diatraea saccharalis TaxID=40085 RepID=A0A9N9QZM4_9NEOP|nr:unnamed protein product [Diatraea saccharalis]